MAYSNIKKPSLFIPAFEYLHSIGMVEYQDSELNDIHFLNPAKTHKVKGDSGWWESEQIQHDITLNSFISYKDIADDNNYVYIFILGHNFHTTDCMLDVEMIDYDTGVSTQSIENLEILNTNGQSSKPDFNGFSIIKAKYSISRIGGFRIVIRGFSAASESEIKIGCVNLCTKWTPPHSPDLSVTMSREYDGVKTIKTKGGATISNAQYTRGGSYWATSFYWELTTGDYDVGTAHQGRSRTLGRRNWSMNFSYLTPANLMPEYESQKFYGTEYDDDIDKNIQQSESFFSRVLNKVQGSHLPFILMPNDTDSNYNPDQWAIVRFDQNNFKITQAAPELYSLSMKLRESY